MGVLRLTRMQRAFLGQVAGLVVSTAGAAVGAVAAAMAFAPWLGLAVAGVGLLAVGFRITWLYGTLYDVAEPSPVPPQAVPELAEHDEPPTTYGGAFRGNVQALR